MKKNNIVFFLEIILFALLVTSQHSNAQTEPVGACVYTDDGYCENVTLSLCVGHGRFYKNQHCCSADDYVSYLSKPAYYSNVQQGCCSNGVTCTSGVIDMVLYHLFKLSVQ